MGVEGRRLRLLPLLLIPAVVIGLGGRTEEGRPPFRSQDFDGSASCAPCHPREYLEWRGSSHGWALLDPIFRACSRHAFETTQGKIGDHCVRCHSPIGTRAGELSLVFDPEKLDPNVKESVSCETCHRMEPPAAGGNVADANFDLTPGRVFYGRLHRPQENTAHASAHSDYLGKSESCGTCHEVVFKGMGIETAFSEWAASPFAARGVQCQDCHMLRYSGRAAAGGPLRETLRRHNFPGVTLPPAGFPNRGYMEEEVGAFLRTALRVSVIHPAEVLAGADLPLTVILKNSGTGHNFPSASFRQLWVEATVLDPEGNAIFRTGNLDSNGDLMDRHSKIAPGADKSLALFAAIFVDDAGKEVPYWLSSDTVDTSLRSLEERNVPYRIPVPSGLDGKTVRIRVRVLLRAYRPYALDDLGVGHLKEDLPIWELDSYDSGPLRVTREPKRKTEYSVPDDFSDLAAAFAALRDGDRLTVGPGEYLIREPLDFRGRTIEVHALYGPLKTTVRWSPDIPDEERSSVVVFHGGEPPEAVLEGFTLEGGSGTLIDGMRRGGGIHVRRSSPTITGNRIVECGARGGVGGGICVEEGRAVISNNDIISCWADLGGGLAYRGGADSTMQLSGNSFQGNLAREGAGIYVEARSRGRVERCVFAGNWATKAGGGLFAAEGSSVTIDRVTFVYCQAGEESAAIHAAHPGVTNSIFWSNDPPGVDASLSYCAVDFPGPAFPGRVTAFPLFVDPTGLWEPVPEDDPLAGRLPREVWPPGWGQPRRWRGGDYELLPGSPAIDAGDPAWPADPDDTRVDMGGRFREQRLRGFIRGDADGDGEVRLGDLCAILGHVFGLRELSCRDAGDVDDDGSVEPRDAVLLASFLLAGRPHPAPPFPACGLDPTFGDGLSCQVEPDPCRR